VAILSSQGVHTQVINSSEIPTIAPDLVIHLASTKATASLQDAIFSFQDLIQHFNQIGKSPMLVAVTKNGQVIGQEDQKVHIPSTALWGMMRTLRNEFPELNPTTIDIQELTSPKDILKVISHKMHLIKNLLSAIHPFILLILNAVEIVTSEVEAFSDGMTYLVTGGTSGLGVSFCSMASF
jgi:FlaA1/EpsC-like NDP-sugar epimerase